ncbi:MAG: hypothetical protein QOF64_2484 [Candidatus Binatota bacterium]|nr:hypothetical protein [Candidatus Binatota bacterium]
MQWNILIEYFATQTPMFVIAVMGLIVAGLALTFGICVTYYLARKRS